jgi:hypothetical protein
MKKNRYGKLYTEPRLNRRDFLKYLGITGTAFSLNPFVIHKLERLFAQSPKVNVYKIVNGDCFQNVDKLFDLINISHYIDPTDVVVLKGNAQWYKQGYTHTGVIKAVINHILNIPNFSGEIILADNVQAYGSDKNYAFNVAEGGRVHNWPDHNWTTLVEEFQANGKPVSVKRWYSSEGNIDGPQDGEGWIRDKFTFDGRKTYLSYPVFESPLTAGRMIDMKNGVFENGAYSGRKVKAIFIPNLNNHGKGKEDYAGVTSAIKSFFGATEIHYGAGDLFQDHYNIHGASFSRSHADYAGELVARYLTNFYKPVLYITAAMWSGHYSRTGDATETKTVLACENPATLDYIACKDVISPYAPYLNPDNSGTTRDQILGCIQGGIGTINPNEYEVISYDFNSPSINRLDIDKKIKQFKEGNATEQEVKDIINQYMKNDG